jgi:hypothetical protein
LPGRIAEEQDVRTAKPPRWGKARLVQRNQGRLVLDWREVMILKERVKLGARRPRLRVDEPQGREPR